jgi:hypothetical protein
MRKDVRKNVKKALSKPLPTIEITALPEVDVEAYKAEALSILNSPVWRNEVNTYLKRLSNEIIFLAKDYDEVLDLRMSINGVKFLQERFESIAAGIVKKEKLTDPFAGL